MQLIFSEPRMLWGLAYFVGEYEVDDVQANRLLAAFPTVVKEVCELQKVAKPAPVAIGLTIQLRNESAYLYP